MDDTTTQRLIEDILRPEPGDQPFPTQRTASRIQALETAVRALAERIDELAQGGPGARG